ncbi:tRNA (guanine(37)-N1)-methyltransferase 1 [Prunus yedoensis var. nudiflora]|uniref:tRNA (guanine(37)-N1)-methyltransferase n=1 Tax=Prunus yedoensis var. nudiflora TaxID=2094558 RepID=A0A314YQU2_PRUYE|nr:tRNA (guanine(37)-N1)-methyltransferase 1 [Prunus yedoensis var. nudiflora]
MVVTKLFLRPHSLPLSTLPSIILLPKIPSLPKKLTILSLCNFTTTTQPQISDPSLIFYGPSLHKGTNPTIPQSQLPITAFTKPSHRQQLQEENEEEEEEENLINAESFSRVFDIAALRVPAKDCFALESRLRGHLLNWPRIRNIARVAGDEVEEELAELLANPSRKADDENALVSLNRRMYGKSEGDGELLSPVLYREKLAKTFDSRGYVKFRNLAKMSRPNQRKKRRDEEDEGSEGGEGKKRLGKGEFSVLEVVDDEEEEGEDLKGLLGDEFEGRKKWRGSTRLLLLDERCANGSVEDLPEAIKVVMKENTGKPLKQLGILHTLNLRDEHLPYKKLIAKVVLDKHKPKIQTVVNKIDAIDNDYRTMQLEVLSGNHSLVTTVVENGLRFQVDLAKVYWNSRLATERQRLLNSFTLNDVVCDVFSGVGPIAMSAARIVKRVYANDLNPHAIEYLERNSVLNKLERKIKVFTMDGRRFINAMFASDKAKSITHVVMNLPNDAAEYLDAFRGILVDRSMDEEFTLPKIHVYGFSKAQDPEFDFHQRIRIALSEVAVDVEMRRVRLVAPGKWMLCASFILPKSVAFAKPTSNM